MPDDFHEIKKYILFICTSNLHRSVIAENILRQELKINHPGLAKLVDIESAGVLPLSTSRPGEAQDLAAHPDFYGRKPNTFIREHLRERGINIESYRSRKVTKELIQRATLILAMEHVQKEEVLSWYPEANGKIFTLKEFVLEDPGADLDIGDPYAFPLLDEADGRYRWAKGLVESNIAELEQCLSDGMGRFIEHIRE